MSLKVSVVICTYNRVAYLPRTLEALAVQTVPCQEFEILLIDNNSSDRTPEACREFQQKHPELNFRYTVESRQGLSYARNRGIEEAQSDLLVFIDDDAFAAPDYLQNLIRFFETTPDAAAAGGRIYPLFESKRPDWLPGILMSLMSVIDLGDRVCLFKKKFPIGANMAFRKKTLQTYGNFNVKLGRRGDNLEGAEEKDLFLKIIAAGEKVYYIPDATVRHIIPDKRLSFDHFRRQAIGIGYSERVRSREISTATYCKSLFRECLKWGVSWGMCFGYWFTLRFRKGWRLIVFRWYVSKGLLTGNLK